MVKNEWKDEKEKNKDMQGTSSFALLINRSASLPTAVETNIQYNQASPAANAVALGIPPSSQE